MAWTKVRERTKASSRPQAQSPRESEILTPAVSHILASIDAESIVLSAADNIIFATSGVETFNLVRDARLTNEEMLKMVRAVRRFGKSQEATLQLPRGPIGSGIHDILVRVIALDEEGSTAILIFDDSEMRRLDSIRRDFVANISHELKTPIGALSILSEAVLGAADDPEAIQKFATRMQAESKRLTDLIQEIINLSRLQDEDPLKNARDISLLEVLQEAIDQSQLRAESMQISVLLVKEFDAYTKGDRSQILMAVSNLIENAINYSPKQTRVVITLRKNDGLVEIAVTDQGIGIPEKDLERIFERFYRVDPARSRLTGGTGLGLSIVKHVATNHGGDVAVWSVPGAGSTFTLRLPEANQSQLTNSVTNIAEAI